MSDGSITPETENTQNSDSMKIDQGENKTVEVSLSNVNGLFADIKTYNRQFSIGSMMSRMLLGNLKFENEQENNNLQSQRPSLTKEEDYQKMSASSLSIIHGNVLNQLGLSLEPVSGKSSTIMGQGEQAGEGEMRLNISDKKKFLSFLGDLKPEQIENTELRPNLESLSDIFSKQVLDQYNLSEPSDEALQLLGNLGEIVSQYKRLGMEQAVVKLETYLIHARQGDLKEYIIVEQKGLLSEPNKSFGPADWQKDATPQFLEGRWENALHILDIVKGNSKAITLYEQLKDHLKMCVDIARNNVPTLRGYNTQTKTEFIRILEQAKMYLEEEAPKQQ